MPFVIGESVGPYRLIEQLGQGGMATVFKAYHPALDRYVAIKALHPAFTEDPNFLARFQREAQVVAKLEHPNIVPVFDYSEYEGRPYLVLKFIEGGTLKARFAQGELETAQITQIVENVGAALAYAHGQGVLHRDVKPSNVMLSGDGRITLTDFGLARMAQAGESTISSDVMLGTPQYISPEQAMGQRDLDNGTDIYSFGVLLYEMAVGRVPYSADTPYSIIHDHIYAPLPLPSTINADIPEPVERFLLKALAKDRLDRFADVDEMVAAWKKAISGEPEFQPEVAPIPAISEGGESTSAAVTVQQAGQIMSQAADAVTAEQGKSTAPGKKKQGRSRWIWLAVVGVILAFCLCIGAALVMNPEWLEQARIQQPTPTEISQQLPLNKTKKPAIKPGTQVPGRPTLPPDDPVVIAQQSVDAEPENPFAYMELAMALWDNDQMAEAERVFEQALKHAGEDYTFYAHAGEIFLGGEQWLRAAEMYARSIQYSPEFIPPEIVECSEQSLYLAAQDKNAGVLFANLPLERYNGDIVEIARARHSLYHGDAGKTLVVIRRLHDNGVELRELKLLEAEMLLQQERIDEAREKLIHLVEDEGAPLWTRQVAENILNEQLK